MTTILTTVLALLLLPMAANAQFGKIKIKGSKFDDSKLKALHGRIDKVVAEYEDATAGLWTSTELLQEILAGYKGGEFPILTQNWNTIRTELNQAKKDAQRKLGLDKRKVYLDEMVQRQAAVRELLDDPVRTGDIRDKLTVPDKDKLSAASNGVKDLPAKDLALINESQAILKDSIAVIESLTKQIASDPLKAGKYKKMLDKLSKSLDRLKDIPGELQKQVTAVERPFLETS